jgi:transcriptional regulator with XRE-family HTH domain
MGVVDRIKEEMIKKGFSQNKLAKAAQMSQSGLSSILNGNVSPKENTLQAIALALNVPLSELIDEPQHISTDPWDPEEMAAAEKENDTIRILARGVTKMSPENRQKLLDVARVMFAEDFDEQGNKR